MEKLGMSKLKEILRLRHECNLSARQISRALNVSHTVVNNYLSKSNICDKSYDVLKDLSYNEIISTLFPTLEKKYNNYGIIHRILYSLGFKSANVVIAQTQEMKEDAIEVFALNEKKIKVMNNPLDKIYINQSIANIINPFEKDKISAVVSGRLKKEKGFDLVLKSMPTILKNYPNFVLHILGYDEGERDNLIQLSKDLNIQNSVIFHDYISNPYSYYVNCDLFILSSYKEGFPNVMLENYYLNTPLVATKCVPIVEQLIINGKNGYVCEVNDLSCIKQSILNCIKNLTRNCISNKEYSGSNLQDLIKEL